MPVMILLILFIVDAAIFTLDKAIITNASGELARKAIVLSATSWSTNTGTIKTDACTNLRNSLISFSGSKTAPCGTTEDLNIQITLGGAVTAPVFNTQVTATITYKPTGLFWNVAKQLISSTSGSSAITLTATTSMRHE